MKSIAKRPNKIQPTVESKSGQVSNQFLVKYADNQYRKVLPPETRKDAFRFWILNIVVPL